MDDIKVCDFVNDYISLTSEKGIDSIFETLDFIAGNSDESIVKLDGENAYSKETIQRFLTTHPIEYISSVDIYNHPIDSTCTLDLIDEYVRDNNPHITEISGDIAYSKEILLRFFDECKED